MSGCDIAFHSAAIFDYSVSWITLEETAVRGTLNILEEAKASRISRVVMTSTSAVLGYRTDPGIVEEYCRITQEESNAYVLSKVEQERSALQRAKELGIDLIIVYPTVTVGPFDSRLGPSNGIIVTYLADPFRMTYRGGINIVAASDVGNAHMLTGEGGDPGRRYVIGCENLEWEQVHRMISELAGTGGPHVVVGHTSCFICAGIEELKARFERRRPLVTRAQARMVGRYYWYESEELLKLGFRPKPTREALAESVGWLASGKHVSREVRCHMRLAPEVYRSREVLRRREAALRSQPWHRSKA
jgi:dihydroflavonol-4-reductase